MAFVNLSSILRQIWRAAGGGGDPLLRVDVHSIGDLSSAFLVTDLAAGSIAAAGLAVSELVGVLASLPPRVTVDRRLASFWFASSLRPQGWSPPPPWDPIAGDYPAADGWIRLHTNAPSHRRATLAVLGTHGNQPSVARAVTNWSADTLEAAIVAAGGCAATMRSLEDWAGHPQGRSVAGEPLIHIRPTDAGRPLSLARDRSRPLRGIKVLDLTRVLAGPIATRFLAGFGASVLRIDPLDWDEPAIVPEIMTGKATARLDLRQSEGLDALKTLLREADVLVHGYRPGALDGLGLDPATRRALSPGLIEVCLDAYGWTGPWHGRRGFDSLVQMSAGLADAGMRAMDTSLPTPLPVQALDHATGYMMAAAAVLGIVRRIEHGCGTDARLSLARTGALLAEHRPASDADPLRPEDAGDTLHPIETTPWGPARRLRPPLEIDGTPLRWSRQSRPIGSDPPEWPDPSC